MIRAVLRATAAWGGGGVAAALAAPPALAAAELLHYPATVSTALAVGAVLVLAPMGAARGALNGAERVMVPAAGGALAEQLEAQELDWTALDEGARTLRAQADRLDISASLLSTTGGGTLARGVVGLFMPSTEVLLEHIATETTAAATAGRRGAIDGGAIDGGGGRGEFLNLAKGATNGMIAGQITSARDKITMVGLGLSALMVVGAVIVDRSTHAAVQKKERALQSVKDSVQSAKDLAEEGRSTMTRAGDAAKGTWHLWKTKMSRSGGGGENQTKPPGDD
jgi:hypothetical protein